jgi:hypothetical protein
MDLELFLHLMENFKESTHQPKLPHLMKVILRNNELSECEGRLGARLLTSAALTHGTTWHITKGMRSPQVIPIHTTPFQTSWDSAPY